MGVALKEPKNHKTPSIDYAGAALLMIAISLLMLALVEGNSVRALLRTENLLLIGSGIALIGLFVFVERRAVDPIIPFSLFRTRTVTVAVGAGFLAGIAMFGGISFVPLFAQGSLGMTATQAGSLLTPLMLSWVMMSIIGGRFLPSLGYRPIAIAGFIVMTGGFVLMAIFDRGWPTTWLYFDLVLIGAGLGMTMLTLLIAVQQAVERSQLGIATSLNQFSRAIGGAFGVAVMGAVLSGGLAANLRAAANTPGSPITVDQAAEFASNPNALIEPQARSSIPEPTLVVLRDSMTDAIHPIFWVGAGSSLMAMLIVLFLPGASTPAKHETDPGCGEKLLMAEQTTINPRNQVQGVES